MQTLEPSHWLALAVVLAVALLTLSPLLRHRRPRHHHKHRKPGRPPGRPPGKPLPSLRAMQAEHDGRIRREFRESRRCGAPRVTAWERATRSR